MLGELDNILYEGEGDVLILNTRGATQTHAGGPTGESHPGGAGGVSSCCQLIICLELEDYKTKTREREEAKIKVSVQNLVEEMMDIVECGEKGEEGEEICETIVDEILCSMFGVRPLSEEEMVVKALVLELVSESVEKGVAPTNKKKSVILPPKTKKKHFSIFEEIPGVVGLLHTIVVVAC